MKEVKSEGLEFAQALNKWMEENNISEPQLVELTGIAQSSVNEYRRKGLKGTEIIRKTTIKNLEKLYQFTKLPIIATILHQSKKGRSKKSSPSMAKIPPKERIPQTNLDPLASIREINLGLKAIANLPENLAKLIAIIGELIQKNDSLSIAKNTDKIPDLPEKMPQEISVAERMRHFNQLLIILSHDQRR
jgi:predicted XRE-type DNA-binding protein